ncbi:MAG: hypothetical protein QM495_02490 [Lutibacter sp.]|uniref:hypothetical protein n=1 Tax=Lutibacter sp. TaxID=1925666 RepID=UPI00385DA178
MKKIITLFIAITLLSCNDGNFDVPAFEFTDTVNSCGEYVLYIANSNSTEVLALNLTTTQINSTAGEKSYAITPSMVNYRIFEEGIGSNYFCEDIPPSSPKVVKELIAESGNINITTVEIESNGSVIGYEYTITISDLLFNDNDERILFESLNFGVFIVNL